MNGSGTGRRRMGESSAAIPCPQPRSIASAASRLGAPDSHVRGSRVDGTQMREHLLAALAADGAVLSTNALAQLAPWHVHSVRSGCASCHPEGQATPWNVLECHGSWHVIERPRTGHDIHPHLQRLVADGLVERSRPAGDRRVYWAATVGAGAGGPSGGVLLKRVAS